MQENETRASEVGAAWIVAAVLIAALAGAERLGAGRHHAAAAAEAGRPGSVAASPARGGTALPAGAGGTLRPSVPVFLCVIDGAQQGVC